MDVIHSLVADELAAANFSDKFEYGEQDLGSDEIRVLVVMPDCYQEDRKDIHCYMIRMDLAATERFGLDKYPFVALSYVWGSQEDKKSIFINGKTIQVTKNLYEALLHIREVLSPVPMWIDAVCINQNNDEEKGKQLRKMTAIYRQASAVIIWLGPAEGDDTDPYGVYRGEFAFAANFLASVGDTHAFLSKQEDHASYNAWVLSKGPGLSPLHAVLWAICSLPLWTRVWIMQEIVLAGPDAFILWGQKIIDFKVMDELLKARQQFRPVNLLSEDSAVSLKRFVMATQIIGLRFKKVGLLEAMLAVRYRSASNPHDYLYGLLGFAEDGRLFEPDYKKPIQDVFLEIFDAIMGTGTNLGRRINVEQAINLDILSTCDRGWQEVSSTPERSETQEWPTWLPDWSWTPIKQLSDDYCSDDMMYQSHVRSLLLDSQDYTPIDLNACGSKHNAKVSRSVLQLRVHGIEYDTVREIIGHETGVDFDNTDFWVDFVKEKWDKGLLNLHNVYESLDVLRHACERTARYGHETNVIMAKGPKMKAFDVEEAGRSSGLGLCHADSATPRASEPFDEGEKVEGVTPEGKGSWNPTTYLSIGTSKSSYCITQRGYFGRSPMPPQVGDKVCIFHGGKVPFLLRPQENSDHFKLAGEIYIHGIMKGAAMNAMKDEAKDFVLI
ncbi:hypothetical protein KVR01_011245 [Diaporthe batatas]|uniref:uncharacterized protein n=1 Tax=Diaporthe batatas TaxID=748121 RepID=UPI001D05589F|nr:uncharacterized protein KVR01_011245 [Diaporthe batatas]KAG8158802.1 hypothetical protein KVR01_011245 [Diaporthe batatas]